MLKLMKYLKDSAGIIAVIIALLFLQAFCDLSLPGYTSNIVNVGIQQGGVENAVPDAIREETMNKLTLFMKEEDKALVLNNYKIIKANEGGKEYDKYVSKYPILKDTNLLVLNTKDKDTISELNDILGRSMLVVSGLSGDGKEAVAMREQMQLPKDADVFMVLGQLPAEQLSEITNNIQEQFSKMPELIITQSSIAFVKAEYKALGVNLDSLQTNYIFLAGAKMLALALLGMICAVSVVYLSSKVAASLSMGLREQVYKKVISFSNTEFDKFSTASLITRSTNDIQQIQMLMVMVFRIVLYAPILGIGGIFKVLKTNTSMAWIIAVAVAAIIIVVGTLFGIAMPKFKALQTLTDRLNLVTREILTGLPVIRAFSTEKHEEKRFADANTNLMKTNLFVNRAMTFMMPTMMLIMNGITVLIVYKGAYGIDSGAMQVGDLMAFIQYTMQIIMSFLMISMMSIMLPRASVSATRVNEILETVPIIKDPEVSKKSIKTNEGTVEFKDVTFRYPEAEEDVLSNISFVAKKGETTAFIGSTGSGKSTLVNLIPRFFDVTEGKILVDGIDVRDFSQKELRAKIGYVPQKGVLFSGTIESNLRFGKAEATQEEIEKAAKIAQALDFINDKDDKFDSHIAQGGDNVSGGQKQRLSIARAIARNPEIYIFDDSFSALDYKTDIALRRALKNETNNSTTLIVAQRISTILHAEQILVLDEGMIVGRGTHKELLKSCEVYKQIAMSQLSKEELGDE